MSGVGKPDSTRSDGSVIAADLTVMCPESVTGSIYKIFGRIPLTGKIVFGMALGITLGLIFGKAVSPLGEIGKTVIQFIKTLATPLLFFAVIDAFLKTEVKWKNASTMVVVSLINATIALVVGLTISNLLKPGVGLDLGQKTSELAAGAAAMAKPVGGIQLLTGHIPTSIVQPFADNAIIAVVLLSVLFGLALRRLPSEQRALVESGVDAGMKATSTVLEWIIQLIPLAVFCVVAKTVGEYGLAPFKGLFWYVGVALLGLLFQIAVVYQLWLKLMGYSLRKFWQFARVPAVYALGASSSLATLPVTLGALGRMKVSEKSSRLAACVGTNLNNDGILLYEAMAVLFVAQVYGIDLSLGQQVLAALACLIAGIGIPGIPEAGLISLSLVLAVVGLPVEILPLLLTVDWILSRARAMTNVVSDMLVSVVLDRWDERTAKPVSVRS